MAAGLPTWSPELPQGGHALGRGSSAPGHPSAPTPGHGRTEAPTAKQSKTSPFVPKGESQTPPVAAGAQLVPGCQLSWGWLHPKIWASPGAAWPGGQAPCRQAPTDLLPSPASQQHRDPHMGGEDGGMLEGVVPHA